MDYLDISHDHKWQIKKRCYHSQTTHPSMAISILRCQMFLTDSKNYSVLEEKNQSQLIHKAASQRDAEHFLLP